MIASAWDNDVQKTYSGEIPTWTSSTTETGPVDPTMELIEKLHKERVELSEKIEKLKLFITKSYAFRDIRYRQRTLLEDQLHAMNRYEQILVERMVFLNQPNEQ